MSDSDFDPAYAAKWWRIIIVALALFWIAVGAGVWLVLR